MAKADRRPMTLLVMSAEAERLHMALMVGATAAAMGRPVTYFFSKGAIRFLTPGGWADMRTSTGHPAPSMDSDLDSKGIADSSVLMDGLAALDVRIVACETALREHGLEAVDLIKRPAVEVSGLADIIEKGAGGDWLTF